MMISKVQSSVYQMILIRNSYFLMLLKEIR